MDCTKEQLREAWLTDLETTQAEQACDRLQHKDAFCCLGRACVVAETHGVTVHRSLDGVILGVDLGAQPEVMAAYGFVTPQGGEVPEGGQLPLLTNLNDSGYPFPYIAEQVRKYPQHVWKDSK